MPFIWGVIATNHYRQVKHWCCQICPGLCNNSSHWYCVVSGAKFV